MLETKCKEIKRIIWEANFYQLKKYTLLTEYFDILQTKFCVNNVFVFIYFREFYFLGSYWQLVIIGSSNDFAPEGGET